MPSPLANGQSELDSISVQLLDTGRVLKTFDRFTLNSDYLQPVTTWNFDLGGDTEEVQALMAELLPGARIQVSVNNNVTATGFVDRHELKTSRDGGTALAVQCSDILGPVVDGTVDPLTKFSAQSTITDVLASYLHDYDIGVFYYTDDLNRNVLTGKGATSNQVLETKKVVNANGDTVSVSVMGDSSIQTLTVKALKPKWGEGTYAFLDGKLLKRFGLHLRAAADGTGVIVDSPNFDQAAIQRIRRNSTSPSSNNVEFGSATRSLYEQPAMICAVGKAGGQEFVKVHTKVLMVNEIVGVTDSAGTYATVVDQIIARYPTAKVLPVRNELFVHRDDFGPNIVARPLFLEDPDSRNIDQLEKFVRREMAKRQQKALEVTYELEGLTQDGAPYAMNTVVDVDDDVLNIHEPLWVKSRKFTKSRGGGTRTELKLIRLHTLFL